MRMAALPLVLSLLVACGDDRRLARRAAEVRELWFAYYPEVTKMSPAEFHTRVVAEIATMSDEELTEYAESYGRLGYFDVGIDVREILTASQTDWVAAVYWPDDGSITIVGDVPDDIVVHEYVHALQDQHFGFRRYDNYETSDGFLARRAVIEGDAVLAQYRFALQEKGVDLGAGNWVALFNLYRGYSDSILAEGEYPPIFLDYPSFCYAYGLELTAFNLTGVTLADPFAITLPPYDWGRQDDLFINPRIETTEEVLLLDVDVDAVELVGPSTVPPQLADRLEVVDHDILGEWYSYLLFYEAGRGVAATRAIAARWDGDSVLFLRDTESGNHALVWVSVWDDATSAINVVDTMWTIYGRNSTEIEPDHFAHADDGEEVWIEHRGNRVVVTKNLAYELIAPLVEAGFSTAKRAPIPRKSPSLAELVSRLHHR